MAFANLSREFLNALAARKAGRSTDGFDYPHIDMGLEGVRFIHAVVESANNGGRWVDMPE